MVPSEVCVCTDQRGLWECPPKQVPSNTKAENNSEQLYEEAVRESVLGSPPGAMEEHDP